MNRSSFKWSHHLILFLTIGILGCNENNQSKGNISPSQSEAVFNEFLKPLAGTWKGRILTYSDPRGQVDETPQPKDFTSELIINRPTKTETITSITETYINDGEFSQKVKVIEQEKGKQKYTNHGYRKIEDGVIVHRVNKLTGADNKFGFKDSKNNFGWLKEEQNPQVVEYFKYINKGVKIRVIGWGYYEGDDLTKAPRIWYLGDLKRIN